MRTKVEGFAYCVRCSHAPPAPRAACRRPRRPSALSPRRTIAAQAKAPGAPALTDRAPQEHGALSKSNDDLRKKEEQREKELLALLGVFLDKDIDTERLKTVAMESLQRKSATRLTTSGLIGRSTVAEPRRQFDVACGGTCVLSNAAEAGALEAADKQPRRRIAPVAASTSRSSPAAAPEVEASRKLQGLQGNPGMGSRSSHPAGGCVHAVCMPSPVLLRRHHALLRRRRRRTGGTMSFIMK
eukprot:3344937-Prymnesium_polylepis.1